MQTKRHTSATFLRLVKNDQEPRQVRQQNRPNRGDSPTAGEAERAEARFGHNIYSTFIRNSGHLPSPEQAATIGKLMTTRVRASDGTLQPPESRGARELRRARKEADKEWSRRFQHLLRTKNALAALSENEDDPSSVLEYARNEFRDPVIRQQLERAISWLTRFVEETRRHENPSGTLG